MKKYYIISGCILVVFVIMMFLPKQEVIPYNIMSTHQAYEYFKNHTDLIILDVREQSEFDQGHIPGAILLPLGEIEDKADSVLPDKDYPIFVYCRSGNRSVTASVKLVKMGYTNVTEFGGIINWEGGIAK